MKVVFTPSHAGATVQDNGRLRIRIVNRLDHCGGAEVVAWDQLRKFHQLGHDVRLVVGYQTRPHPLVVEVPSHLPRRDRVTAWRRALGGADVVHLHNLHGGYFNHEWIPAIGRRCAVVLTLHDQHALSGGCVHTRGCERWRSGCGACPQREPCEDNTSDQWERRRKVWGEATVDVVCPARWLFERSRESILAGPMVRINHISNGVDLSLFDDDGAHRTRAELSIGREECVILSVGQRLRTNPSKDWGLLVRTLQRLDGLLKEPITLIIVGDSKPERLEFVNIAVRAIGVVSDRTKMAQFYTSSDIYVHAAHVETFSLAVLEAMAGRCAVVATDANGIEEQIGASAGADGPGGIVVSRGDETGLCAALDRLVAETTFRRTLARSAADRVRSLWSLERHIDAHLKLYRSALAARSTGRGEARSQHDRPVEVI